MLTTYEPASQAAEFLITGADAAVHHCTFRAGKLARQRADPVGVDSGDARDPLRCPLGGHLAHAVQPVEVRLEVPHRDQIVGEQRLHHGQQQRRRPPA